MIADTSAIMAIIRTNPPMRLMMLFIRQRAVPASVIGLLLVLVVVYAVDGWVSEPNKEVRIVIMSLVGPAAIGSIVGIAARSPSLELEQASAFPLHWPRAFHLVALFALGTISTSAIVATWPQRIVELDQVWFWIRNLVAMTGLALILARIVGSLLSWILPCLVALTSLTLLSTRLDDLSTPKNEMFDVPWWNVALQDNGSMQSWFIALIAFGIGLTSIAVLGPSSRERGEA